MPIGWRVSVYTMLTLSLWVFGIAWDRAESYFDFLVYLGPLQVGFRFNRR